MASATAIMELEPAAPPATMATAPRALDARDLHKAFGGQVVLDGVNVQLRRGEVALLRGGNGSGKTTLLNILTGNMEPDAGVITLPSKGRDEVFTFPKAALRRANPFGHFAPESLARHGVGRSWQETRLFGTQSLRNNIAIAAPGQLGENPLAAVLRPVAVRKQDRALQSEAERALDELGLPGRGASTASRVSLGQTKRVAIARAVRAGANVLFLDEPLAGLDEAGISEVLRLLQSLARDEGLTLVIVEHVFNIPRILDFATTVWTLSEGRLTVEGPDEVRAEVECHLADGLPAWLRHAAGEDGEIETQTLPGGAVMSRVRPAGVTIGRAILEVSNLTVARGGRLVIGKLGSDGARQGVSFTLHQGELCVLQAPNGWGKTTLLEALAGLLPCTGTVKLLGQTLKKQPAWVRRRLGLSLLQSREHTFAGLSVRESLRLSGVAGAPAGLEKLMERKVSDLSGGEKQKVAVACALSAKPAAVLLDEPFLALDRSALNESWSSLQSCIAQCGMLIAVPGSVAAS